MNKTSATVCLKRKLSVSEQKQMNNNNNSSKNNYRRKYTCQATFCWYKTAKDTLKLVHICLAGIELYFPSPKQPS